MSESRYPIPAGVHRAQETIQRSRFITTLSHAPRAAVAHEFVRQIRDEFPDATHNCWAFAAGPPGSTSHVGLSDDGEPHNTAGKPMLNTLLHSGVGEIVAVCTRYYGGAKLGTGGLSRAYSSGVKLALDALPTEPKIDRVAVEIVIGYENVNDLHRIMTEMGGLGGGRRHTVNGLSSGAPSRRRPLTRFPRPRPTPPAGRER